MESILKTFDHGLSALEQVVLLEQKLLPQLFKSNQKLYLKVPVKPESMPEKPDPANKKLLPDPNTWIFEAFDKLRTAIQQVVEPLHAYQDTLKKYKSEYILDPIKVIKDLDDDENPPEAEVLRKGVIMHRADAERLMNEIPDSIIVSMFQINVGTIRDVIAKKHTYIAEEQVKLIAKMAKRMANSTIDAFYKINDKINTQPKDIEELSTIKDFMQSVPSEIEKLDG